MVKLIVVLPPVPMCSKLEALRMSALHLSTVLMTDAAALLPSAAGARLKDPGALLSELVNWSTTVVCCFLPGSPPMILLAPALVEAGFRMLLVRPSV